MRIIESEKFSLMIRQLASQFCATCVPYCLMITCGLSLGFATVLIPELYKKDPEVPVTFAELTWISSMNFFANPIGALITGPLTKRLGRKKMLVISAVPFLIGWLLFHWWATNAWTIMLGFALLGISTGLTDPSSQIYVTEISQLNLRGTMTSSLMVASLLGIFLQVLIDSYVHWRSLALISTIFPLAALIGTFFIPESPHWLISKNRLADAEKSLQWLRGWTDAISVQTEYKLLLESSLSDLKNNPTSNDHVSFRKLYLNRKFLLPFALVCYCFFLNAFNGAACFMMFSVLVFRKLESPIDEHMATLILTIVQLVASVLLMVIVHRTGKRRPTLASLIGTSLVMFTITLYVFLKDYKIIQKESSHSWIPMTLILLVIFISCMGIRSTPWFFAGEMFSVEVRGVAVALLITLGNIFVAFAHKSFLYKLESFTLTGTFFFFALMNLIGFVVLYWTLPETEGKTFAEIDKHFVKKTENINIASDSCQTNNVSNVTPNSNSA